MGREEGNGERGEERRREKEAEWIEGKGVRRSEGRAHNHPGVALPQLHTSNYVMQAVYVQAALLYERVSE